MGKPRSRVEQEAREARQKAVEVERKIKELSSQILNPEKYFKPRADERTQTTVEKFRRYFVAVRGVSPKKRKATRVEMRAERTRAVVWMLIAVMAFAWILGKLYQTYGGHTR